MHVIAQRLLDWYAANQRVLPWRSSQDPYAIWVSEIMLQQTRVETVLPYFHKWMARFPTVEALASADLEEVLNLWEGLGYYRRARYLHQAAQQLIDRTGGQLPTSKRALRELPGIGEYTAAAIGAFAYDQDTIALDGNLKRVLARLFDIDLELQSTEAVNRLRQLGQDILPTGKASDFNQALMDLGALICTPQNPGCSDCPLAEHCLAYAKGRQDELPVKRPKGSLPQVERAAAVLFKGDQVLLGRRPPDGLLADLWEFPGLDLDKARAPQAQLANWLREEIGLKANGWQAQGTYRHAYSHFKVVVHAYLGQWQTGQPASSQHTQLRWVRRDDLEQYPMGKVDRLIADSLSGPIA